MSGSLIEQARQEGYITGVYFMLREIETLAAAGCTGDEILGWVRAYRTALNDQHEPDPSAPAPSPPVG